MRDLDLIRAYRQDVGDDEAAETVARDRLRAHISAARPGPRARRLRRRLVVSIAALLVVCSSAAAAGLLLDSDDLHLGSIACMDSAAMAESGIGSATFVEPAPDPVAACEPLWLAGQIDGRRRDVAPDLVACASAGRPVAVIPGTPQTCRELDLEPLPEGYAAAASATGRAKAVLQRDSDLHRPWTRCDEPEKAMARSRRLLADAGIGDFPVEFTGDGPCAGVYLFDRGAVAHIELLSRADAADRYERHLVGIALESLEPRVSSACRDPRRAAARARRLLRDAGLSRVTVRVEERGGPCLEQGYLMERRHEVLLRRASRAEIAAAYADATSSP
jgi:hypothetical protein